VATTIRLDDCTDWGNVDATDDDRAAYEQAVANAIGEAYPVAEVIVQCVQRASPRVIVTTRGEDGRILHDDSTSEEEAAIEAAVLDIARTVWDAGEFWTVRP
jgi:hypothetical protein